MPTLITMRASLHTPLPCELTAREVNLYSLFGTGSTTMRAGALKGTSTVTLE